MKTVTQATKTMTAPALDRAKSLTKTLMTQQRAEAKPVFLKMTTTGTGLVTIMAVEMKTMRMRLKTLMN